jgi:putative long chain acyl-CoA synthase
VVEFFATTDGQAVLANVSGVKVGSKGRPLPGGGQIELAAYDADADLILEDDRGFVRVAGVDEVGVLLARPRGPVDPTASVKRGVFAPADTWVSTESLFRRDADGDFWLVGTRNSIIHTARGVVFDEPITDAVSMIDAVDLAVTYGVTVGDRQVAVTALTLRPGATVTAADLTEAIADPPVGLPPDVVHVVPELPLSATYRPVVAGLRAAGVPKASRTAWYLDTGSGQFRRLTAAARSHLAPAQ